ncbi:diguanylate cyclase (GGDEF) domain-containing protein [Loktanella atrilutea]|uniref:Diguanylate cyclase (GGDEF) domain-containing protein n=1 Tax=Loktanella atrilutea TaxID=366533 RepID=A0A1M4X6B4_LOKAT|nr:GGDEF domain-containing protein [Loktanella atrilutea]SHE88995.1 diguanylate cyclase (GGDEF) domain-containing protein [Loktanella atrilutea]
MDLDLLQPMLAFSSEACIVLDRDLTVVAGNGLARADFNLSAGGSLGAGFQLTAPTLQMINRCFASTAPIRISFAHASGRNVNVIGWRLGAPYTTENLIALKLEASLRIRSEFIKMTAAHRSGVQRAKRLHMQKKLLEDRNRHLATVAEIDAMTGLLNAQGIRAQIRASIAAGTPFALLYIDMNGLKAVNDTWGHAVGDAAICALADAIRVNVRQDDAAARLGGDEFAVLVRNVKARAVLCDISHGILTTVAQHRIAGPNDAITLDAAIGGARWPQDGTTAIQIEKAADAAMYVAKTMKKGPVIAGDPRIHAGRVPQSRRLPSWRRPAPGTGLNR